MDPECTARAILLLIMLSPWALVLLFLATSDTSETE